MSDSCCEALDLNSTGYGNSVAILLCTYNGERFLNEQLESYHAQTHRNWQLRVSDDGSKDRTMTILQQHQQAHPQRDIQVLAGPCQGFVKNFLSFMYNSEIQADYYAWSDQDDIWDADKLERALDWLKQQPVDKPALYCSRTCLVSEDNQNAGTSPLFRKTPSFRNALMQNIGGGNTMVFNQAARELLRHTPKNCQIVSHDWWAYLLISACGGALHYDSRPSLRYRQHSSNLVGGNASWGARLARIRMLFQGHFRRWTDLNIAALQQMDSHLSVESREVLNGFVQARQKAFPLRLVALKETGIYRQTTAGNLGLVAAAVFNKI